VGEDKLTAGVAVMARPPGKKNSTIHLLSGGEKALTAVALVFSISISNRRPSVCSTRSMRRSMSTTSGGSAISCARFLTRAVVFITTTRAPWSSPRS